MMCPACSTRSSQSAPKPAASAPRVPALRARRAEAGDWRHLALAPAAGLRVGAPHDAAEAQADAQARRVLGMSTPPGRCAGCADAAEPCPSCGGGRTLRRRHDGSSGPALPPALGLGSGRPLDAASRAFFEPRFGHDFGGVRVHADPRAHAAARGLHARAFTLGHDVGFAAGAYAPHSAAGRELLAHELAHVVQADSGPQPLRRRLSVDPAPPTDPQDPLSTLSGTAFSTLAFTEMGAIVHALCDDFDVDATGEVASTATGGCADPAATAAGSKPVGCCCLCALTDPAGGAWTIHVTGIGGPRTVHSPGTPGGDFFLHPRNSSFEFGAWDVTGARVVEDPVVVAGHELCGHGALLERGLHPADVERVDTDVHDPTVRVENLIKAEQGLPGNPRGLAADPHRGESFARITLREFPFNGTSLSALPAPEAAKLQLAKDFINANNTWVDVFGHSDPVGSASAKLAVSQGRADNTRSALITGLRPVSPMITKTFSNTGAAGTGTVTVSGNRFTRIEGRSDFDLIPGASDPQQRRVDIVMPTRPAGAEVPNAGTPTTVAPVGPASPLTFLQRRFLGNPCDQLLARSAWF
ncbi:uncharacterized protein DUF4157 [Plasticicumulans lactativorans]|uniref:Uncharacterized protein DUF4157 n=1 Tax=Plasticicumulans lactativorans TaxID=1133106 RepID=A0A4R2L8V5_9GAMM|nr:DUF4157 domain-containing protein [Plasticicumulans lactativorans]TCO80659.1 uncharacterized protein DUF4157 [Plasticicumulans lactativorans]